MATEMSDDLKNLFLEIGELSHALDAGNVVDVIRCAQRAVSSTQVIQGEIRDKELDEFFASYAQKGKV